MRERARERERERERSDIGRNLGGKDINHGAGRGRGGRRRGRIQHHKIDGSFYPGGHENRVGLLFRIRGEIRTPRGNREVTSLGSKRVTVKMKVGNPRGTANEYLKFPMTNTECSKEQRVLKRMEAFHRRRRKANGKTKLLFPTKFLLPWAFAK